MTDDSGNQIKVFAFVIDGEVAWLHSIDSRIEQWVAAMQSDPKVIEIPENVFEQIKTSPLGFNGWTYDGTTFSPPTE